LLSDTLISLPTATLQLRLVTAIPPSSVLTVSLLKSLFVTSSPLSSPEAELQSVASLRAALAVHLNWRADDAGTFFPSSFCLCPFCKPSLHSSNHRPRSILGAAVKQVRSRLRTAASDSVRPTKNVGTNELLLLALIHRALVSAARNDTTRGGADAAARSAYDALSRTVREAARRRDMDAVEEATVEHYLHLIESFLSARA
jgi:hypothetical protein